MHLLSLLLWSFTDSAALLGLLTVVPCFIGFPRSHSIWEPFGFAWHLIYSQTGKQHFISNTECWINPFQLELIEMFFLTEFAPVVGPWSQSTTKCQEGWWAAEQHGRHLHPRENQGWKVCWWQWSPAQPVAGLTAKTPEHHPRLCRNGEEGSRKMSAVSLNQFQCWHLSLSTSWVLNQGVHSKIKTFWP